VIQAPKQDLNAPLAHYWTACSHNSYIIGDQLTGLSSADAYRRQLLQGCRHVEIDCWDGKRHPIVTHGNTFCTSEAFDAVAKAVADMAFVTSGLPVILSLEMHCCQQQQHRIAAFLVHHLGSKLMTYQELRNTGRASVLSPEELRGRAIVKGKVKLKIGGTKPKKSLTRGLGTLGLGPMARRHVAGCARRISLGSFGRTSAASPSPTQRNLGIELNTCAMDAAQDPGAETPCSRTRPWWSRSSDAASSTKSIHLQMGDGVTTDRDTISDKDDVSQMGMSTQAESNRLLKDAAKKAEQATEQLLASIISLRATHIKEFIKEKTNWPLTITSINEDRLLEQVGLSVEERNHIEGLSLVNRLSAAHNHTAVNLARDPPREMFELQRRTSKWLLRPYPHGLRFSGMNMDPLSCWMTGAQNVALNLTVSPCDLPVQLHHALFSHTGGYVLKPQEMRSTEPSYWPPARDKLHRVSIEALSLHNLPKKGERRPDLKGSRGACHKFAPELSSVYSLPDASEPTTFSIKLSLHPIGGFSAVSGELPLPTDGHDRGNEMCSLDLVDNNGLSAPLAKTYHCLAAEPDATFLRLAIVDNDGVDLAYETAVLSRLRRGYRVFRMRDELGTRIQLCHVLVKISFGSEANQFVTATQLRHMTMARQGELETLRDSHQEEIVSLACRHEAELAARRSVEDTLRSELSELRNELEAHRLEHDAGAQRQETAGESEPLLRV